MFVMTILEIILKNLFHLHKIYTWLSCSSGNRFLYLNLDITNDVSLSSAVTEAVSIELNGSNIDNHNVLSLDGHIFTFNGAGKSSKIADLDIQSDKQGSGIVVNNQTFTGIHSTIIMQ